MNLTQSAMLICALSFFIYGWCCLYTKGMVAEFKRYRLSHFRRLTGMLQLLGATGLLAGLFIPWVGGMAAAGLSLQMACGLGVRIKIRDTFLQCLPATFYMLLCGWVAIQLL